MSIVGAPRNGKKFGENGIDIEVTSVTLLQKSLTRKKVTRTDM